MFFRTVEDAGPYINEVGANIVRSTVGRGLAPAVFYKQTLFVSSGRGEQRSPAGDRRSPLQIGMLIVKNIKFYSFSRVAEGVDPYN